MITAVTDEALRDARHGWAKMGFLSRFVVFSYSYNISTVMEILSSYSEHGLSLKNTRNKLPKSQSLKASHSMLNAGDDKNLWRVLIKPLRGRGRGFESCPAHHYHSEIRGVYVSYTVELSKREIEYMIWALRMRSENSVIGGAVGKLLDALKLGDTVRIISAERIRELEEGLMQAVARKAELEGKIRALESEKASLLAEIEALKAIPALEAKASALESGVTKLKEEKKTLEEKGK